MSAIKQIIDVFTIIGLHSMGVYYALYFISLLFFQKANNLFQYSFFVLAIFFMTVSFLIYKKITNNMIIWLYKIEMFNLFSKLFLSLALSGYLIFLVKNKSLIFSNSMMDGSDIISPIDITAFLFFWLVHMFVMVMFLYLSINPIFKTKNIYIKIAWFLLIISIFYFYIKYGPELLIIQNNFFSSYVFVTKLIIGTFPLGWFYELFVRPYVVAKKQKPLIYN